MRNLYITQTDDVTALFNAIAAIDVDQKYHAIDNSVLVVDEDLEFTDINGKPLSKVIVSENVTEAFDVDGVLISSETNYYFNSGFNVVYVDGVKVTPDIATKKILGTDCFYAEKGDMYYKDFPKLSTISNGSASISMLKIFTAYEELFLRPLVEAGILRCLGTSGNAKIINEIELPDLAFYNANDISSDDWDLIYAAWPEGKEAYDNPESDSYGQRILFGGIA